MSHHEPTYYVHGYLTAWHCHYLVTTPGQWPLVAWPRERGSHHEPTLSSLWKCLWVTLSALATMPRKCPLVSPWNKKKNKIKKRKNKGKKGLGKTCIHDRYSSPSTKAPTGNIMHPCLSLYPYVWTSLIHIISFYMVWMIPLGDFPFLMDTSPIGCLVFFLQPCIVGLCNIF